MKSIWLDVVFLWTGKLIIEGDAMRFDVITLFPELFAPFLTTGVTRRAYESRLVDVHLSNLRDFAEGNYKRVDDRPFGGGPGMVMLAEPLFKCLTEIQVQRQDQPPVVLFSPVGKPMNHSMVARWAASEGAVLVCGRYEGIDQRFIDEYVTEQISLGDLVLSGGEIAAMAVMDAVARLQPGVLNDEGSHQQDSFNPKLDGLLDCPHYTRPEVWHDQKVPDVLRSGHHRQIERWRREQSLLITEEMRPELIESARRAKFLESQDERFLETQALSRKLAEQ